MSRNKTYQITKQINWKLNEVREIIKGQFGVVHSDAYLAHFGKTGASILMHLIE